MDMVKIYRASNNTEADFIKTVLADNEIESFIQGYHHRSMLGLLGPYVELDIMVAEKDAQRAEEILAEFKTAIDEKKGEVPEKKEEVKSFLGLRPRHVGVAFILAFIFPGLGNIYAGQKNLGQWLVMGTIICYFTIFMFYQTFFVYILIFVPLLIALDAFFAIRYIQKKKKQMSPLPSTKGKSS